MAIETYEHSGSSGGLGVPITAAVGGAAALLLALAYVYIISWIPFIYVNFFATIGLGVGVGLAVGWAAKVGKIRNTKVVMALSVLLGLFALYSAWAFDPLARLGPEFGVAFNPETLVSYISAFYENGLWGIGRTGGAVKGIPLAIVWLIEAAIIVAGTAITAVAFMAEKPFCEACQAWTKTEEDVRRLVPADEEDNSLERVLEGDLGGLDDMHRADPSAAGYFRLDLAGCPRCSDSNFLTINLVTQTVDSDGDLQTNVEALVTNMVIEEADIARIRGAGREPEPPPAEDAPEEV